LGIRDQWLEGALRGTLDDIFLLNWGVPVGRHLDEAKAVSWDDDQRGLRLSLSPTILTLA
jgi:hypothetical protein